MLNSLHFPLQSKALNDLTTRNTIRSALDPLLHVSEWTAELMKCDLKSAVVKGRMLHVFRPNCDKFTNSDGCRSFREITWMKLTYLGG